MVRRVLVACSLVLAFAASTAHANGRPPASETIHFRQGTPTDIIAGLTFGAVLSHDGGATWQWMCEAAVGYAGVWDPIYEWTASGALFATTFNGLTVNRDGCSFVPTSLGLTFATALALGPDGALYVGMSDNSANLANVKIYKSTDDGMTFNAGVTPPGDDPQMWWQSLATAPSDPMRVYLAGYFGTRTQALYTSTDGAATFTALPVTAFTPTSKQTVIDIVGVDPVDPKIVYARVSYETAAVQTSIYRSADAGMTWTKVVCATLPCTAGAPGVADTLGGFAIDSHENVYVGSLTSGEWKSTNKGVTFTQIPLASGAKHLQCLAADPSDNIWGCGDNYGTDAMGIGKTTDGTSWTTTLMFQAIQQPVACAASTTQYSVCQEMTWCGLEPQLMITSTVVPCAAADGPPVGTDASTAASKGKGCCDAGGAQPGSLVLAGFVVLLLWRPRRHA